MKLLFSVVLALALAGACKSTQPVATPSEPSDQLPNDPAPTSWGDPPHASETGAPAGDAVLLQPYAVSCTEMACGSDNPCCNSCGAEGWALADQIVTSSTTPFPECELDGCGKCAYAIAAIVDETTEPLDATSWVKVSP